MNMLIDAFVSEFGPAIALGVLAALIYVAVQYVRNQS